MTPPNLLLSVKDLHAGYGRAEVLTGLNFQLTKGQVVTVIGPNGAGKSTTLNALMAVLPSRGQVVFDGVDLADVSLEERVMLGLALVPEKRELFGSMPVEDNLILGGYRAMKLRVPHWRNEIERVYTLFPRLKERRLQVAGTMSGGEQQMCAIGRALMSDPKLLLLDEPSAGLAPVVVQQVFELVKRIRGGGLTVLIVEQNVQQVLRVVDRAYLLEAGTIRASGTSAEMLASDTIKQAYLGV